MEGWNVQMVSRWIPRQSKFDRKAMPFYSKKKSLAFWLALGVSGVLGGATFYTKIPKNPFFDKID